MHALRDTWVRGRGRGMARDRERETQTRTDRLRALQQVTVLCLQSFLREGRVVGLCWAQLKPKGPNGTHRAQQLGRVVRGGFLSGTSRCMIGCSSRGRWPPPRLSFRLGRVVRRLPLGRRLHVGGGVRIHPENARMSGRHGVQCVAQCVACAALALAVWK